MAERARIAPDRFPGAALAAAQLLSHEPAPHARAPGHPSPPTSHEREHWSTAHSHTDAVPGYHAAGRYRPAADDLIDEWSSDDHRMEQTVGCAFIAPSSGVDWMGCGVYDHHLSVVDREEDCDRSADCVFGDGAFVDRCIGAVCYVLNK